MAAPAIIDWEGNGRGKRDHATFASFQCFVPSKLSLRNLIYSYLALFSLFLEEIQFTFVKWDPG